MHMSTNKMSVFCCLIGFESLESKELYKLCHQLLPRTPFDLQNKQDVLQRSGEQRGRLLCSTWHYTTCSAMWPPLSNKRASCISVIQNLGSFPVTSLRKINQTLVYFQWKWNSDYKKKQQKTLCLSFVYRLICIKRGVIF